MIRRTLPTAYSTKVVGGNGNTWRQICLAVMRNGPSDEGRNSAAYFAAVGILEAIMDAKPDERCAATVRTT